MSKVGIYILLPLAILATSTYLIKKSYLIDAAIFSPGGMVTSGGKFGINIGDRRNLLSERLDRIGLNIDDISRDKKCVSRSVIGHYTIYSYDMSWRKGVICVGIAHGRVSSIGWSFSPFAP